MNQEYEMRKYQTNKKTGFWFYRGPRFGRNIHLQPGLRICLDFIFSTVWFLRLFLPHHIFESRVRRVGCGDGFWFTHVFQLVDHALDWARSRHKINQNSMIVIWSNLKEHPHNWTSRKATLSSPGTAGYSPVLKSNPLCYHHGPKMFKINPFLILFAFCAGFWICMV